MVKGSERSKKGSVDPVGGNRRWHMTRTGGWLCADGGAAVVVQPRGDRERPRLGRPKRDGLPAACAVGETVILLHLPLPSVGVFNMGEERGMQQNGSLADGCRRLRWAG